MKSYIYTFLVTLLIILYGESIQSQTTTHQTEKTVGICLGGGGAIGFAHLGALQALEEHGIFPTHLSGTSIGSVLGVMYAKGYSPKEIMQIIKKEKMYKMLHFFKPNITRTKGLSNHKKINKFYDKYIASNDFDSLRLSMSICCVNINNGKDTFISSGHQLKEFTIASMSVPFFYEYVTINGINYVDGAIVNNFPVEPLLAYRCNKIIGINVINFESLGITPSKWELLPAAYALINESMNKSRFKLCDYYIPLEGFNSIDFFVLSYRKFQEFYQKGYDEMIKYIHLHPDIMEWHSVHRY